MVANKYTIGGAIVGAAAGAVGGYFAATKIFADKIETKDPILAIGEAEGSEGCDGCNAEENVDISAEAEEDVNE